MIILQGKGKYQKIKSIVLNYLTYVRLKFGPLFIDMVLYITEGVAMVYAFSDWVVYIPYKSRCTHCNIPFESHRKSFD